MKIGQLLRDYSLATYYGADRHLAQLLPTALRVARARLKHGIGPHPFSMLRLAHVPETSWDGYITKLEHLQPHMHRLTPERTHRLARNKVLFHEHCVAAGLPHIPIVCRLGGSPDPVGDTVERVKDANQLEMRLATAPQHLFVKPIGGLQGKGTFVLDRHDDHFEFDGSACSADDVFAHIDAMCDARTGFVIQPQMRPHAKMVPLAPGNALPTVRVVTAMCADGPQLLVAVLKIPTGTNITDNFGSGSTGNLLAGIDMSSGVFMPALGSTRRDWPAIVDVDSHPDSGYTIAGARVPFWLEIVEATLRGQQSLPDFRTIGWDVAATPDGIVLVEANSDYDPVSLQMACGRGLKAELSAKLNIAID